MGYIGQEPSVGGYELLTISGTINGSNTSFTLNKAPATANHLMLIINGVLQIWGTGYAVSGTTLTTTSAPATGSTMACLMLGSVYDVGKPTDGTVPTLSGSTNNQIVTVTGANAMTGEANLSFDGSSLMVTDQSAFTPLGRIHVRGGTSGVSAINSAYDELVLEENGNTGITLLSGTPDHGAIVFGDSDDADVGMIQYHHNGNTMRFHVDADEVVRINNHSTRGASFNIGDIANFPEVGAAALHVRSITNQTALYIEHNGAPDGELGIYLRMSGDNGGNAGLQCNDESGTARFVVRHDGDCENSNNSYGSLSDRKLKKDIVDATSQWDDVKAIRLRNFTKIDDVNAVRQLGVVAQELEEAGMTGVVKETIDYEEVVIDGHTLRTETGTTTKAVKYSVLYMKAIKALQEAMTRIETLEAKVAALEG